MSNVLRLRDVFSDPAHAIRFILDTVGGSVKMFGNGECGAGSGEDVEHSVARLSLGFYEVFDE